jgi:hypothetical protein
MLPGVGALAYYSQCLAVSAQETRLQNLQGYAFPRDAQGAWAASSEEFEGSGLSFKEHMIAGASAGVMEHIFMFPVDTIKTRMQTITASGSPEYRSIVDAALTISRKEGFFRLYRGMSAIASAAIPSHAVYFATYEYCKEKFGGNLPGYHMIEHGLAGAVATMAHDAIVTPLDVVKQRLQMYNSAYRGIFHCIRETATREGFRAFYASYPATVLMNVPMVHKMPRLCLFIFPHALARFACFSISSFRIVVLILIFRLLCKEKVIYRSCYFLFISFLSRDINAHCHIPSRSPQILRRMKP